MSNTQPAYPDDEHRPDCKSNLGVQYSCDCGYAFRIKDEDAKPVTTKICPSCKKERCECVTQTVKAFMEKQFADPEIKAVYDRLGKR